MGSDPNNSGQHSKSLDELYEQRRSVLRAGAVLLATAIAVAIFMVNRWPLPLLLALLCCVVAGVWLFRRLSPHRFGE